MTFFLEEEPAYQRAIRRFLASGGAQLIAGGPHAVRSESPRFLNSIYLLSDEGVILGRYDKQYLLPFAEYSPLAQLELPRGLFGPVREFSAGESTQPLPTRAGLAGIVTCNEAMFPEIVAQRVAKGAAYLVNPSNDTWIPHRKFAAQQFDIISLRAIEQRRYLVRVSTSGPSAIVDSWGRVLVRTEPFTRDLILGSIRPMTTHSVYGRVGDVFAAVCAAAVLIALLISIPRDRGLRERRISPRREARSPRQLAGIR
jgi:apolipoprotein N-acyltransferase